MKRIKDNPIGVGLFLALESALYLHLLCTNHFGSMFGSILVCFLFALWQRKKETRFLVIGMAFTVAADICLVLCNPQPKLLGMVFFLFAQTAYAIHLQSVRKKKEFLLLRSGLVIIALLITILVLGNKTDALALVSLAYYANLLMNIAEGFSQHSLNKLLPLGFVLFLLCDTVIGLQVAADGYLAIRESSTLYQILYPGFNLAWLFYLPSQVLITLSHRCYRK